ncbi:hypothetical protein WN51_13728 [Melipona quadrifasciata]|uniref:Uncharacterized protein n=1 Tax=Melipona quadrifasciata TaxID=166423 RepID=A0A0M8ZYF5_9HYME|nr:hypothetical protein WN51_13728 [Melipona quadrifasciata]
MNQKFPLKSFEDKALISHIVTRHLPLYCYLCGEIFKQIKDSESLGTCKWWKSKQRHSLVSAQKSILGTPPLVLDEKPSQFGQLISPPELYRNTSTPMVVDQKAGFNFKTPNVPNFTLKTPKTDPASLNNDEVRGSSQRSSLKSDDSSNYVTCPSANIIEETPFRTWPPDYGSKELPRSLKIMKVKSNNDSSEHYTDNHCMEDMELTNVEDEMLPNSQSLETCQTEKRLDSLKKVRFSDQHETPSEPNSMAAINMTENEEYFDTSEMKEPLESSQIKIYEDNAKNIQKENHNPNSVNNDGQQSDDSSRVLLMVIVENNSKKTTTDLINSGLKKLEGIVTNKNLLVKSNSFPGSSNSVTSVDSYYSISSQNYYSSPNELSSSANKDPTTSNNSTYNNNNGGIFSMMANAMKNVMRSFSAISTTNIEKRRAPLRGDNVLIPSTSGFSSTSNSESFSSQRAEKRPRDAIENVPLSQRSTEQAELLSPVPKRHRGWYRIKAREPIARMRQLSSQRGVSSETQVFHQGSLSVGNTVLPLPDRAHQSTQTE